MHRFRWLSVLGLTLGALIGLASPAQAAIGPWRQISAGEFHTCGITTANDLHCWGVDAYGQIGDGVAGGNQLSLRRVGAAGVWSNVDGGGNHTCGITTAKNLYCWGNNEAGQIGTGTTSVSRPTPFRVGGVGVWFTVASGFAHTCAITTGKNLYCWGSNDSGQTGDGTITSPRLSLHRVGAAGVWTSVTAGRFFTCGITTAKNLYCWGYNGNGQVGNGVAGGHQLPLHRVGAAGVWTSVTGGGSHTCGITTAKNLYCWGSDASGQIGDGVASGDQLPLHRVGAAGVWIGATAGGFHTCGVTTARNLYCWGSNSNGQTGDGTTTSPKLSLYPRVE